MMKGEVMEMFLGFWKRRKGSNDREGVTSRFLVNRSKTDSMRQNAPTRNAGMKTSRLFAEGTR